MNVLYALLLCAALALIQVLVGGTRLLFALPAYGLLAAAAVASLADLRRSKLPPNGWCLVSSAVFFGYVLLRALFSPVSYLAWSDAAMVLGALIIYLLTACYLTDPRRRLWVLTGLLALAFGNLGVGVRQFMGDDRTTVLGFLRDAQYRGRASGFYICPDHLAGFLEMMICLSVAVMIWARVRVWAKILLGYVALCCLAGLVLTASRGGYLSMGVGLLVLAALGLRRTRITSPEWFGKAVTVLVVVGLLLAGGLGFAFTSSRLLAQRANALTDTKDIRLQIWPSAVREFQASPVFGTGSSTFLYYGRQFRNPGLQRDPIRVHNDYLELLAEYGVVGAAGLLFFLAAHLGWGLAVFRRFCRRSAGQGEGGGSNAVAWNLGALAAVACLAAHSALDFNLHIPVNALVLAFIFGVLANPGRSLEPGQESARRFRPVELVPRLALPVLAVVLLAGALPKLPGEWYGEQARVALRDGRHAAALGLAKLAVEHEQGDPYLYDSLGQARMKLAGNGPDTIVARSFREAAVEAFAAAVRLAPPDSTFQVHLAEAYTRLNAFGDAEKSFQAALDWDPHSSWVLTYHGFSLQQQGLYPEARAAYERAISLGGTQAANNLRWMSQPNTALPDVPAALGAGENSKAGPAEKKL